MTLRTADSYKTRFNCQTEPLCRCYSPADNTKYGTINCSYMNLTSVPRFVPSTVYITQVDLRNNNIRRVDALAFVNLSLASTVDIYLDENPIEVMDDMAFGGLHNNSVNLHLRSTQLKVSPKALTGFNNLYSLTTDLPLDSGISADLGSVKLLNLYNGSFGHALNGTCHFPNLEFLMMTYVSFPIYVSPFSQCTKPMTSLRYVSLYFTALPVVPNLGKLFPYLTGLSLRYDDVYALSTDINLPNLTRLALSDNKLTSVPWLSSNFERLQKLDLSNNRISVILSGSFSGLSHLTNLDLSGNPISVIAEDAFKATPKLNHFNLFQGEMTTVPRAIRHLTQLYINVASNPIQCTCDLAWLHHAVTSWDIRISGFCQNAQHTINDYISLIVAYCQVQPIG
ncbi:slit homolog 1 protein-like [Liolophura sinensis]|uniref:slit homolog 1 protein-like n=1 Tax=Liolophura sinensis TaxID=3198878 RepID=UPI00315977FE